MEPAGREAPGPYADPELLPQLLVRDRRVQLQVWSRERERLRRLALGILRSEDEADSLVADLFCDFFFHHVDGLRSAAAIPAYLRLMAVRRARRRCQQAARHLPLDPEAELPAEGPDPGVRVEDGIWQRHLADCLAELADKPRQTLKLHFGLDRSYAQIAAELGGTKQAVGKRIAKCLEALRRCLERRRAGQGR